MNEIFKAILDKIVKMSLFSINGHYQVLDRELEETKT